MKKEIVIIVVLFIIITLAIVMIPGMNDDYIKNSKLYISEIMANNSYTIKDDDGEYSDYIEIYNGYDYPVNLKGYYLSDEEFDVKKWQFPDIMIEPHQYILIYASSKDKKYHTNFKLNSEGEVVTLTDSTGNIISKVTYKNMQNDISYGYTNGKYIYSEYPTPNEKNSNVKFNFKKTNYDIIINEYITSNKRNHYSPDGYYYDWVELYNNSEKEIIIDNLYLTDDRKTLNKYKLPKIKLEKKDYLLIYLSGEASTENNSIYANFKLSTGEEIILSDGKNIVDQVKIVELPDNVSYGKKENKWYYFTMPTPCEVNNTQSFSKLGE